MALVCVRGSDTLRLLLGLFGYRRAPLFICYVVDIHVCPKASSLKEKHHNIDGMEKRKHRLWNSP
jgi:hypothetical protein